jgi:hypothetical protein
VPNALLNVRPAFGREKLYLNKIQPERANFNRKPEDICAFFRENANGGRAEAWRRIFLESGTYRKNDLKSKKSRRKEVEKNMGKMYITMMSVCYPVFKPSQPARSALCNTSFQLQRFYFVPDA